MKDGIKILSLMTFGRSGSKLFHSLLDGHPQIICFPRTLRFNEFWQSVRHKTDDPDYIVGSFIEKHKRFFSGKEWYRFNKYDRADQLGPERNETFSVDANEFRKNALSELKDKVITRPTLFLSLHIAYHLACGKKVMDNSLVLYHLHDISYEDELKICMLDFPQNIYVLVMTRHPVKSLNSCVEKIKMQNTFSCSELFFHYKHILFDVDGLIESFPNLDIKVLPFEQLHIYHEKVMRSFIDWVGIRWDDSLMDSTMHGKLWWGNGKIPRNNTNPNWKLYQPSKFLERKDWNIFCSLACGRIRKYGYLKEDDKVKKISGKNLLFWLILPMAGEWSALKCSLSVFHWINLTKEIIREIADPRLRKYDFYTNKELPEDEIVSEDFRAGEFFKISRRIFKLLYIHFRMVNLLVWSKYVLQRIKCYYGYAKKNAGIKKVLPNLILEEM